VLSERNLTVPLDTVDASSSGVLALTLFSLAHSMISSLLESVALSLITGVRAGGGLLLRASILIDWKPAARESTSTESELEEGEQMREKEAGGSLAARLKGTSQDTIACSHPVRATELLFWWPPVPSSGSYAPTRSVFLPGIARGNKDVATRDEMHMQIKYSIKKN